MYNEYKWVNKWLIILRTADARYFLLIAMLTEPQWIVCWERFWGSILDSVPKISVFHLALLTVVEEGRGWLFTHCVQHHSVDCRPRSGPRCLCGTWGIVSVTKVPLCFHSHPEDALEMIPTSLCIKGMCPSFHKLISVVKRKCRVEPGWFPPLKSGVLVPQGDSLTHLGSEDCRVAVLPEMHEALQGSARINLAP